MIPWLTGNTPFPPVTQALREPNGLLAAGGDLTSARLLEAYRHGIFPWFSPGDPVLWWSPDPRMVLIPDEFKLSDSLAKILRNGAFEVRTDTSFEQVMRACAAPRGEQPGTWIDEQMIAAYCALHRAGYAHSVETWLDGKLVGGLYGVAIGQMFYGESMFSFVSNASKIALAHLTRQLQRWQSGPSTMLITSDSADVVGQPGRMASSFIRTGPQTLMIDCQMYTPHLASLGARLIPREEFIVRLEELINRNTVEWKVGKPHFPNPES